MNQEKNTTAPNHVSDLVVADSGELNVLYLPGYPKVIRFDASRGVFTDDKKHPLTKTKEPYTIQPIAFRVFRDDILGMGVKRWAEFFFVDNDSVLCNLLVHGYSVDNLMSVLREVFYQRASLTEVALTLLPAEKVSKAPEASGKKYYMCDFAIAKLPQPEAEKNALLGSALRLWRQDTLTGDAQTELSKNYRPPIQDHPETLAEEIIEVS